MRLSFLFRRHLKKFLLLFFCFFGCWFTLVFRCFRIFKIAFWITDKQYINKKIYLLFFFWLQQLSLLKTSYCCIKLYFEEKVINYLFKLTILILLILKISGGDGRNRLFYLLFWFNLSFLLIIYLFWHLSLWFLLILYTLLQLMIFNISYIILNRVMIFTLVHTFCGLCFLIWYLLFQKFRYLDTLLFNSLFFKFNIRLPLFLFFLI